MLSERKLPQVYIVLVVNSFLSFHMSATVNSLRTRYAKIFGDSDDADASPSHVSDDDTGGADAVSQPTRPSTPEYWPDVAASPFDVRESPFDVREPTRPSTNENWRLQYLWMPNGNEQHYPYTQWSQQPWEKDNQSNNFTTNQNHQRRPDGWASRRSRLTFRLLL